MNKPHIIGLTGPAGCGKDTVAQLLATHLGFAHLAFADALRAEVCEAYGIDSSLLTRREAYGIDPSLLTRRDTKEVPTEALALDRCTHVTFIGSMIDQERGAVGFDLDAFMESPRSPRQIMQWWGTDYRRRHSGEHYWTRTLTHRIHAQQQGQHWRHVISDVRFQNEADAIRALGGVIWQVKRPGLQLDTTHVSEVDGSEFKPDAIINNRHDIRHLQAVTLAQWFMREASLTAAQVVDVGIAAERMDEFEITDSEFGE